MVALAANLLIAAAKVAGGAVSGSAALLSEAAHSVADSINELFLLAALRRSGRLPDAQHPFGYGKERFFWSMLAAVGIFVTGSCFSFYQAAHSLFGDIEPLTAPAAALAVLAVAFVAEGISLARAVHQIAGEARDAGTTFPAYLRQGADPTVRTVFAEDSTAVGGVVVAAAGIAAHVSTGWAGWEGLASLVIGMLLAVTAYRLGRKPRTC